MVSFQVQYLLRSMSSLESYPWLSTHFRKCSAGLFELLSLGLFLWISKRLKRKRRASFEGESKCVRGGPERCGDSGHGLPGSAETHSRLPQWFQPVDSARPAALSTTIFSPFAVPSPFFILVASVPSYGQSFLSNITFPLKFRRVFFSSVQPL